ncbi:hypothetical protein CROQUDRAFT_15415, partial [Cronartium quercuum f. sp. fusiforme G11]
SMIESIVKNLWEVVVPQGKTRVPSGLGTKANGKLKASEWHSLFATHLPLAAIENFIGDYQLFARGESSKFNLALLNNFVTLVECTHITGSRTTTSSDSACFGQVYQEYTSTSKEIPEDLKILPNHYYTLHTPAQM